MRGAKMNGFVGEFRSSFLSCEKDTETIIKKLFVDSRPYSDELKRLLLINTKDCLLDKTNPVYLEKIKNTSVADLRKQQYIKTSPKLALGENEEVKSYILITFDNFTPSPVILNPTFAKVASSPVISIGLSSVIYSKVFEKFPLNLKEFEDTLSSIIPSSSK